MIKRSIPWYRQPPCLVDLNSEYARYVNSARIWNLPPTFAKEVTPTKLNAYTKVGTITTSILAIGPGLGVKGDGSTGSYLRSIANLAPQAMWMVVQFVANTVNVTKNGVYVLGSTSAGANSCNVGVYSGSGAVSNIIGIFKSDDTTTNSIIKQGPVPIARQLYTVILVAPSALKADAYLYINGEKYTDDAAGSTDVTLGGTALGKEAVCAFKRGGDFDDPINFGNDTILFTARGLGQIPEPLARDISINPYMLLQKQQRSIYVSVAGGGLSASLGQPSETDTVSALTSAKAQSLGLISAADTAQGITSGKAGSLGLITSTETAQSLTAAKSSAIGQATETDSLFTISTAKSVSAALVTETETAQPLTAIKYATLGQASESDDALALVSSATSNLGLIVETDTAFAITAIKTAELGLPSESDSALSVSASKTAMLGLVTEIEYPLPLVSSASSAVGQVVETDTAFAINVAKLAGIGYPTETDSAPSVSAAKMVTLGLVTETGYVFALTSADEWTGEPFNFSSPITRTFDFSSSITKNLNFESPI